MEKNNLRVFIVQIFIPIIITWLAYVFFPVKVIASLALLIALMTAAEFAIAGWLHRRKERQENIDRSNFQLESNRAREKDTLERQREWSKANPDQKSDLEKAIDQLDQK